MDPGIIKGQYRVYRKLYVVFALLSFRQRSVWYQFSIDQVVLFDAPLFIKIIAGITGSTAAIIIVLYILRYFRSFLNEPMAIDSTPKPLVTNGVYKYVRHPLYIVTFIFIWSAFVFLPWLSSLICVVIVTSYTVLAIPREEKKLEMEYGDAYVEYKKKIPKLFPRFWQRSYSQERPAFLKILTGSPYGAWFVPIKTSRYASADLLFKEKFLSRIIFCPVGATCL